MQRRQVNLAGLSAIGLFIAAAHGQAHALSLNSLAGITANEASAGLKSALERGVATAVALLGKPDGFLGNPKVRIPLPSYLEDAANTMRKLGQGKRMDELLITINRAAEAAVPQGKDLLAGAVKSMNINDAKAILTGGDNAVTQFFVDKTRVPLNEQFLPVVTSATDKVGLARRYNEFAGRAATFGLVKKEDANIEQYVTAKSLDGLFLMIGEEEKKIRTDPVGTGSAILRKVFGAMK